MTLPTSTKTGSASTDIIAFRRSLEAAAAAERAGQQHGAMGKLLRDYLPIVRAEALGKAVRGDILAKRLSDGVDEFIKALFLASQSSIKGAREKYAICAVGGYGRRKLAPFSDIDLLFLHSPSDDIDLKSLMDFMLYPLWDSGVKVGHGVHTPKSGAEFAKEDMIARTAYLDARLLCGSPKLFEDFQHQFSKLRRRTTKQFVEAKLEEQAQRQTKAGETRYLIEPDIKEGKGGLRDLQTIQWLYKYSYGGAIGANSKIDKIMDAGERRALIKAERFLWSVRVHLHDLRGRADEKLAFDIQPDVAERLGYADRLNMTAAERLMKHYFVNTVEIGRLTRILCARLEEERTKRLPHLPKFLPKILQTDEAPGKPNLRIRNGRLDFENADKARENPQDLFRLFRAFSKHPKIDFHPEALAVVSEQASKITSKDRKDKIIGQLFAAMLMQPASTVVPEMASGPVRVLRVMIETGLLGKYVPSFGSIVGRIDYGLYRRFTLDEQVLRCIGVLSKVQCGDYEDEHPHSSAIMNNAEQPYLYFLAVFLHETIWAVKHKSRRSCEKLVTAIARQAGLAREDAKLVGWGVAYYSLLARTAERRDLTEAHTIVTFALEVGDQRKLDLILVLSVCHLRVVGTRSWDELTRRRISELYKATSVWFERAEKGLEERLAARIKNTKSQTRKNLAHWRGPEKIDFMESLTQHMLRSVEPDILVRFASLVRAAAADKADAAIKVTPRDGDLEAIVYTNDRPGLLADIAGAVSNLGLSVRSVQALTTHDGKALDILSIHAANGPPLVDPIHAKRLHETLLEVAHRPPQKKPSLKRKFGDRRGIFSVEPEVRIVLEASEDACVVETEGLDRPRLLHDLAAALAGLKVTISSAHIATYGERAVDTFYLRDANNQKITDKKRLQRIEIRLREVLCAGLSA